MNRYILAIDQGTSSTKTIVFDEQGAAIARGSVPLKTNYFGEGFVEQNPEDIYRNVIDSVAACLQNFKSKGGKKEEIISCGISNQRETFIVWDKFGKPLHNAIVWQCKRSVAVCDSLKEQGIESAIRQKTGLLIDPYFSGTKMVWLYQNNREIKNAVDDGEALFGTVDTWLLYKLTGGKAYKTDYTNASRTLFFNLESLDWDKQIPADFQISGLKLPELQPSSSYFGKSNFEGLFAEPIAIDAMIGDSHAAAFGEGCFKAGTAKATLGTGCSILMNVGQVLKLSGKGMVTTICWSTEQEVSYAQEGVIVSCGSTIEWLKNELGLLKNVADAETMALSVEDNGGVYLIPAFSGLGAPHWDMKRKAEIGGITFSSNKNHIVRAALESIPYQIMDVVRAMEEDTGIRLNELRVNGGITSNQFVMQSLSGLLQRKIMCMDQPDISALGAGYLAGLRCGVFKGLDHLDRLQKHKEVKIMEDVHIRKGYEKWKMHLGQVADDNRVSLTR